MILGDVSLGEIEIGGQSSSESVEGAFSILLRSALRKLTFLVDIYASDFYTGSTTSNFPYAIGEQPIGGLDPVDEAVGTAPVIRYGSETYITLPTDSVPDEAYLPKLVNPFNYEVSIPLPLSGIGLGNLAFGILSIKHDGNDEDLLLSKEVIGRPVEIKVGGTINPGRADEYTLLYDEFGLVYTGLVSSIAATLGTINLTLKDTTDTFDIPFLNDKYLGTGGLEGPEELEDVVKQMVFGIARAVEGTMINEGLLIIQFSGRSVEEFILIEDKGVELGNLGDIEDFGMDSLLDDWVAVPGYYITDHSRGMIRLGAKPVGAVTATMKGDNSGLFGYVDTVPGIIRRLLEMRSSLVELDQLDGAGFSKFSPMGPIGFVVSNSSVSLKEAINDVLVHSDAWGGFSREGRFKIGRFPNFNDSLQHLVEFTDEDIISLNMEILDSIIFDTTVGYQKNWTIRSKDSLAASVSDELKEVYSRPYATVSDEDASLRGLNRNAKSYELETYYDTKESAEIILDDIMSRSSRSLKVFYLEVARQFLRRSIGEIIKITTDKYGLSNGKAAVIVKVVERADKPSIEIIAVGV